MFRNNKFLKWMATTLKGHMVLFGLVWLLVMSPVFIGLNYSEGDLTLTWALYSFYMPNHGNDCWCVGVDIYNWAPSEKEGEKQTVVK